MGKARSVPMEANLPALTGPLGWPPERLNKGPAVLYCRREF